MFEPANVSVSSAAPAPAKILSFAFVGLLRTVFDFRFAAVS
jgi:hypothetical protein